MDNKFWIAGYGPWDSASKMRAYSGHRVAYPNLLSYGSFQEWAVQPKIGRSSFHRRRNSDELEQAT